MTFFRRLLGGANEVNLVPISDAASSEREFVHRLLWDSEIPHDLRMYLLRADVDRVKDALVLCIRNPSAKIELSLITKIQGHWRAVTGDARRLGIIPVSEKDEDSIMRVAAELRS